MSSIDKQISLAGSTIDCRCHVCAFFDGGNDERDVMLPFISEGLARGERVVQLLDRLHRPDRVRCLVENGIDVGAAEQAGTLELIDWSDSYPRGGGFDQDAMLAFVEAIGAELAAQPNRIMRAWANMNWVSGVSPGAHDLAEYEARLNYILPKHDLAVVCAYDLTRIDADFFMKILRAHPHVIIGGVLRQNLFYVPPDQLLREFRDSRRMRSGECSIH